MSVHSSGCYSIDADYNIIGFNDTAKQMYASLEIGQKCCKALMGLDSPLSALPCGQWHQRPENLPGSHPPDL